MPGNVYQFGDFRLDCGRFELTRNGHGIRLERKPLELLILLAASKGQLVTRADIAGRLWASEVFVDTEHGINTAIRKLRQALHDDPEQPQFIQTVTGMGYRFIAPVIVLEPEAGTDSQAVPMGEPRRAPASVPDAHPAAATSPLPDRSFPDRAQIRRNLWAQSVIGLVVAGLAVAAITASILAIGPRRLTNLLLHPRSGNTISSLAVLPLDNLSGDPNQQYFADGMTDELTTMLAKNSTLRVTSRTSAMQYKGAHRPLPEIAKELGVDGILEGSVSRTGDQVHMTIQLIQASTDIHLWAESYDRNANDVISLPREAARAIAKRVGSERPQVATPRYVNPAAHDAYLHGRYLWFSGEYNRAFEYFTKATVLQPDYAAGWSGLANFYGASAVEGRLSPADSLAKVEETASKAVELDDSSAEAHLSLCAAIFLNRWDWVRADQECRRAIELDPRLAEAYNFRAMILATLNRHAEAIESEKKASELAPFEHQDALTRSYMRARQFDNAIQEARDKIESSPNNFSLYWTLADTYRRKGMLKEAVGEMEQVLSMDGSSDAASQLRACYQRGGFPDVVRAAITDTESEKGNGYQDPVRLATLYAQLGDREKTLTLLERGYSERSTGLLWIQCDPAFDFLHADDRYRAIVKAVGLPPAY